MVSVLFPRAPETDTGLQSVPPEAYHDLNLDQLVTALGKGRSEYDLPPFFYTLLSQPDLILYRQEVFQDLEQPALFQGLREFAEGLRTVRRYLGVRKSIREMLQRDRWILNAVCLYCDVVESIRLTMETAELASRGLADVRRHLQRYVGSQEFIEMRDTAYGLKNALDGVRYSVSIKGSTVKVGEDFESNKMTEHVEHVFAKFRRGSTENYLAKLTETPHTNHVEAQILRLVAKLFPDVFSRFVSFCGRYRTFVDPSIARFDREIQFFLAYLDYIRPLQQHDLPFCYPAVVDSGRDSRFCHDGFDLPMASRFVRQDEPVVLNSFDQSPTERTIIVTGPNQGGKTTFARMYGQLHVLAALGCPIPGRRARIPLVDAVYTHFGVQERVEEATGKLQEELNRIHAILDRAGDRSVILLNELFSSTTVLDAVFLGNRILDRILSAGAACVYVTFLDELAAVRSGMISMVAEVDPEDPSLRTFKVVQKEAEGQAHARALAKRHRLTYADIKERMYV